MKKGILTSLGLAAVLTLGLASVNEYRDFKEVDAASATVEKSTFSELSGKLDDVVSYSTDKGGGTSAPALNSGEIRLYQNSAGTGGGTITLSAKDGNALKSVTIGSSMTTSVAYTIGDSTTKSTNASLAANGKYTVNDINSNSITFYCMGSDKNSRLYVNYLSVTYESNGSEPETPSEPEAADFTTEVKPLFEDYYNNGVYTKQTDIYLKESALNDVSVHFHTGNIPTLSRKTYYNGNALWMENGTNYSYYGTKDGNMTSGRVNKVGATVDTVAVRSTTMEDYYATLFDFKEGTHNSVHSYNKDLDLTQDWTKEDNVYTSTNKDVFDAFRLFTAPLWIGKTTQTENYIQYTKATVQKVNDTLVMKLYVDPTEYSKEGGKILNADGLFSQAVIEKGIVIKSTLNRESTGITANSSTYENWSCESNPLGINLAGQSAGGNDSIQLRSDKNNSGVVITENENELKPVKVVIEWHANTSAGRTLNVYGNNSVYTDPTELYDANKDGDLLGTIVCGTSTELEITGDYLYIGLRSASKAMYITTITIYWE